MRNKTFEKLLKEVVSISVRVELENYPSDEELNSQYELSDDFYKNINNLIQDIKKKENIKKRRMKGCIFAACLILIFICWYPDAIVNAGKAIWGWFDTHINFYFEKNRKTIPEYQIKNIPVGYQMIYERSGDNNVVKIWKNKGGHEVELIYTYVTIEDEYDNEGKKFDINYDGNLPIYYLESDTDDRNIMLWEDKESGISFTLISTLPYDEMIKIRQSVAPVEEP